MKKIIAWLPVLCWTIKVLFPKFSSAADPVQVFLLAGQSNMVGMGSIDHLDLLVAEGDNEFRRTLWNGTQYKELSNVYMYYESRHGKLTVSRTAGYAGGNAFGPEVLFGGTLAEEDASSSRNRTILLIKVAYGGRCLAVDFRSPSAGTGNYSGVAPMHYGWEYRVMVSDALDALNNIATIVPDYDAAVGYELAGFVWFQGWNDMLDWEKVKEYEENLVHFMRDVRLDVNAPDDLPFGTPLCKYMRRLGSVHFGNSLSYICLSFGSGGRVGDARRTSGRPRGRSHLGATGRAAPGLYP
jgi:Carbohydrate esterase, sialic acid-specific acetylesterase